VTNDLVLARRRTLSEVISDSFTYFFGAWSKFAAVVAPAVLVGIASSLLLDVFREDIAATLIVTLLSLPVSYVFYQLCSAAAVALLNAPGMGRMISSGDALDLAQSKAGDILAASLRSTVIVFLFAITILGIPWAIKRGVQWAFIIQSVIIDQQDGRSALAYSAALVRRRWWASFGRLLASGFVIALPMGVLSQVLLTAIPGPIGIILSATTNLAVFPIIMIATTLIFFDLKALKQMPDKM
jgi:hypothetical protein